MSSLRSLQLLHSLLSTANLNGIVAIDLLCLYLCDLASIELNHCALHDLTPLVPEMGGANFVAKSTNSLRMDRSRGSRFNLWEIYVDKVLKGLE